MRVYEEGKFEKTKGTCLALGSFDALHIAHMKLINTAVEYASQNNLESGVFQFLQRPEFVLAPDKEHKMIYTNEHKNLILNDTGLDFAYFEKFDENFMKMSCEQFAKMLKDKFDAECVVVGFHYRFGHKGLGDCETLEKLGKEYGFKVIVIDAVFKNDILVSSTVIRKLIAEGNVKGANEFLGRHYSIYSCVEHDRGVGTKVLKIPTANFKADKRLVLPQKGVYASYIKIKNKKYASVTNIGTRPTFGLDEITVESHIIDFDDDLYDKKTEVFFLDKIRDEIKFENADKLRIQILSDIDKTRNIVYNIL